MDPHLIAAGRSVVEGVPFVAENWEAEVSGLEQVFPPATTEFFDAFPFLVLNHFVFDRSVQDCGTGQIEVAAFGEIAGTPAFPSLDGFTTPDTESTRATAFL